MGDLREDFAALLDGGTALDLGRGALTIARIGYPGLDVAGAVAELDALAVAARPHVPAGAAPVAAVGELARWLFGPAGFRGNTEDYYDPRNSFLNDVLSRRTGIPITLAVVLIETATRLGLPVEGVGFPGHFLVRVPALPAPVFRDPFFGGRVVSESELLERYRTLGAPGATTLPPSALEPTGAAGILARMLRNLLRVYVEREDHTHALAAVDLLLVLTPDAPDDLRLRGLLYAELDCFVAAAADLRRYLALAPDAADADKTRARIAALERRGPTLH